MINFKGWISLCFGSLFLTSCQNTKITNDEEILSRREQKYEGLGKLFGEEAFELGGSSDSAKSSDIGIGVNSFLWHGALDTLSFMPLKVADPFGGVILTDWYTPSHTPNERIKVDVLILGRNLRADGLKVTVFRQKFEQGQWIDQPLNAVTAEKLEEAIMTKARDFRIKNNP